MRLFRFLRGVRRHPFKLLLAAGAFGVCATLRRLAQTEGLFVVDRGGRLQADKPFRHGKDYFCVRRTKSEVGYIYWVLQGYGQFHCYELYDSWREACDEAVRRAEMKQPWADYQFAAAS